ncbi:uncharacterized protein EAE98_008772 [Botrytis deweyae]|uniref:Uncharacterized protein n=1 Tax=Botrytis deweyae TaxID=2478750 RepID=A0ABQ7IDW3_9HELO|nr:uncharacterized protein EAE98_008772 [Botrytis deweyae]KAF7920743.1 hypothetical protein EAE98_008772 [Botrytis deweyae]
MSRPRSFPFPLYPLFLLSNRPYTRYLALQRVASPSSLLTLSPPLPLRLPYRPPARAVFRVPLSVRGPPPLRLAHRPAQALSISLGRPSPYIFFFLLSLFVPRLPRSPPRRSHQALPPTPRSLRISRAIIFCPRVSGRPRAAGPDRRGPGGPGGPGGQGARAAPGGPGAARASPGRPGSPRLRSDRAHPPPRPASAVDYFDLRRARAPLPASFLE